MRDLAEFYETHNEFMSHDNGKTAPSDLTAFILLNKLASGIVVDTMTRASKYPYGEKEQTAWIR